MALPMQLKQVIKITVVFIQLRYGLSCITPDYIFMNRRVILVY
ncbi:hypothetical protein D083_4125 [Dickeya solani RNS 08.23.3.1.A]|nr:hypothetical protein D083_4125 [Dickeya solani RNS 08.23.3.1.A]